MPYILNIETATEVCSVCVSYNGQILFEREETKGPSHASVLGLFVAEAMQYLQADNKKLDAVAVSCGPGSYTGLRIGVSEAKGLCYGLSVPLIAINTLKIMAYGLISQNPVEKDTLLCPMIDARRMEVYDAVFDRQLNVIRETSADIIDANSFGNLLAEKKIAFFGNGSDKVKTILENPKSIFIDNVYPKATNMPDLAEEEFASENFVDVAYFEPFYLKEFVATTPKNKVLPTK